MGLACGISSQQVPVFLPCSSGLGALTMDWGSLGGRLRSRWPRGGVSCHGPCPNRRCWQEASVQLGVCTSGPTAPAWGWRNLLDTASALAGSRSHSVSRAPPWGQVPLTLCRDARCARLQRPPGLSGTFHLPLLKRGPVPPPICHPTLRTRALRPAPRALHQLWAAPLCGALVQQGTSGRHWPCDCSVRGRVSGQAVLRAGAATAPHPFLASQRPAAITGARRARAAPVQLAPLTPAFLGPLHRMLAPPGLQRHSGRPRPASLVWGPPPCAASRPAPPERPTPAPCSWLRCAWTSGPRQPPRTLPF